MITASSTIGTRMKRRIRRGSTPDRLRQPLGGVGLRRRRHGHWGS
jgi:hypothetical protein